MGRSLIDDADIRGETEPVVSCEEALQHSSLEPVVLFSWTLTLEPLSSPVISNR